MVWPRANCAPRSTALGSSCLSIMWRGMLLLPRRRVTQSAHSPRAHSRPVTRPHVCVVLTFVVLPPVGARTGHPRLEECIAVAERLLRFCGRGGGKLLAGQTGQTVKVATPTCSSPSSGDASSSSASTHGRRCCGGQDLGHHRQQLVRIIAHQRAETFHVAAQPGSDDRGAVRGGRPQPANVRSRARVQSSHHPTGVQPGQS